MFRPPGAVSQAARILGKNNVWTLIGHYQRGFVFVLAVQNELSLLKSSRGLTIIILLAVDSWSIGIAIPGFLESLIDICSVELLCLLAGKPGGEVELCYECLLVWAAT